VIHRLQLYCICLFVCVFISTSVQFALYAEAYEQRVSQCGITRNL